jgi:hypothetical protein
MYIVLVSLHRCTSDGITVPTRWGSQRSRTDISQDDDATAAAAVDMDDLNGGGRTRGTGSSSRGSQRRRQRQQDHARQQQSCVCPFSLLTVRSLLQPLRDCTDCDTKLRAPFKCRIHLAKQVLCFVDPLVTSCAAVERVEGARG